MSKYPATLEWQAVKNLGYAFDLDNLKGGSGFYEVDTPTNGPGAGVYMIQVMKSGVDGLVVHKAWNKANGAESTRVFNGAAWATWNGSFGAVGTGVTAAETGSDAMHQTVLTVASVLPAIAGGANLAVGKLVYTFPAGDIVVHAAQFSMAINGAAAIQADTPVFGLGTVIAVGAVALLNGTGTFHDIIAETAAADCNGTAEVAVDTVLFNIAAAAAHTVHFNAADGWAAGGDATPDIAGTIRLTWSKVS